MRYSTLFLFRAVNVHIIIEVHRCYNIYVVPQTGVNLYTDHNSVKTACRCRGVADRCRAVTEMWSLFIYFGWTQIGDT